VQNRSFCRKAIRPSLSTIFKNRAAITKGGFFYHFDSKPVLAQALTERYLVQDDEIFKALLDKADGLSEDPLHRLLIFLNLLAEMMGQMDETHPGCLVASFTYESLQFQSNICELMQQGLLRWRHMILDRVHIITARYPIDSEVTEETLADMFTAVIEGRILLARNFEDNRLLVNQILAYRAFLRMLFKAQ